MVLRCLILTLVVIFSRAEGQDLLDFPDSPITFTRVKKVYQAKPGPWGELEYYTTYLEPSRDLLDLVSFPSARTEWHFLDLSLDQIDAIIGNAGVTAAQYSAIMRPENILSAENHHRIFPPTEVIVSLHPDVRARLYRFLSQWEQNTLQYRPFFIGAAPIEDWFEGSGLRPELVQQISRLAYGNEGNGFYFSDLPVLLQSTTGPLEEKVLMRALHRVRTLVVRLKLNENSNLDSLIDYWTSPAHDVSPLLSAFRRNPGARTLDIAHLLPAIPRKYLYSFPSRLDGIAGRYPDWFWTGVNFFEFNPLSVYAPEAITEQELQAHFAPVNLPVQFGDLVVVRRQRDGAIVHGCVYLADDIVYSKDSASPLQPWIFTRIPSLVQKHSRNGAVVLSSYRRKQVAQ